VIFVDVETKKFFDDEGVEKFADLEVSFAGAYDSEKDEFFSFWEEDLADLEQLFVEADRVVGYNSWAFDYRVLQPFMDTNLRTLPSLDLMVAMKRTVGFRPKLDDLAKANLGKGKIGTGADAGVYWNSGEFEKLEKYCLEDVRLTFEVWKKGEETRNLKFYNRAGFLKESEIDWQKGFLQEEIPEQNQLELV
jgi:DEAD/DEAH box helicase domain-containing protein